MVYSFNSCRAGVTRPPGTSASIHRVIKHHVFTAPNPLRCPRNFRLRPEIRRRRKLYYVPSECFDAYIDRAQNKVLNRLVSVAVTDGNGTPLEAPAVLPDIFAQIATLEHTLFDIRILDVSSEYFVFLKLNVNLHTPCELYYYNQQIGKLIELYSFNDRELLGLHVMSVERLKGLE